MAVESTPCKCVVCKAPLVQQYEVQKLGERRSLTDHTLIDRTISIKAGLYCSECGLCYKNPPKAASSP